MAGYRAVGNPEVLAPHEHGIGHTISRPAANSIGHNGQEATNKESGQTGLLDKSGQWNLNINEMPLRSQTTFVVPPRQQRNRQWWHRIGLPGMVILTVGTGVSLFSVALLIFLWQGADGARSRHHRAEFWDNIVFDDWSTRLVTICSAAIRVSMGFQIGLAAAAMAAVILETTGSRFSDTAMLSIQRASSSSAGPSDLLPTAWRHCLAGRSSGLLYFVILALTFGIALISTLTSTILLFDFGQDQIAAPIATGTKAVGFDTSEIFPFNGISYWKSRPMAHWRFAESRPSEMEIALRTENAVDTGDVYRAMLPFDSPQDRTTLEYYHGPAVVINQRTACFAPTLDNVELVYKLNDGSAIGGLYLSATAAVENQTDLIGSDVSKLGQSTCRIHNGWNSTDSFLLPISLCSSVSNTVPIENGTENPLSGWAYGFNSVLLVSSGSVLNGIAPTSYEKSRELSPPKIPKELDDLTFRQDGPWTVAYTAKGTEVFNATICYISQNLPHRYNVTMTGRAVPSEPEFLADWSTLMATENGTGILQQLGVGISPDNTRGRGILDLQVHSGPDLWANPDDGRQVQTAYSLLWSTLLEFSALGSWSFAGRIMKDEFLTQIIWPTHPEHAAVFQNILHLTGDPAQAIQAVVFRFYQMLYYDWLPNFEPTRQVTTIHAQDVLIPQQWRGFVVVMAIIVAHFIVTTLAMALFAQRTESSLLGNAWQAVSQVVSPDTQDIIRAAGSEGMKDKDVEALARSTGRDKEVIALSSGVDSGRTELRVR
ncbi:Hypothetical protein NCS54_01374900 [Fusarium falciforme]|uniref:Hypothetical protein n=1 Tax=Fusarium falciforme TaxID=195108 RepID=UPI0023011E0B|nr:Hypothetical protein NCS54_01374900 [Fusarium falciforme]WAO96087.1 Hypothetical protein NCS54_01374900 [Fusarium falciforme]